MAEPIKRGDKYRHSIMVKLNRISGTFDTKREAREWEAEMRMKFKVKGVQSLRKKHSLSDGIDRYLKSISTMKKNAVQWETRRLNEFLSRFPGRNIEDITSDDIAGWRDDMLTRVSGSTVNRYSNLYGNLFTVAKNEWKWIDHNPFSDVRRPKENPPRPDVWGWRQIRRVLREGQRRRGKIREVTQAFHIALATGLRLKEALVAVSCFNEKTGVIVVSDRKESHHNTPEKVPTLHRGRRVLSRMPPSFRVGANEASTLFSKLCNQVGISDLQFRDSRATALTLMARKVPIEVLQRISRHKDMNLLTRVYYRETAEAISARH